MLNKIMNRYELKLKLPVEFVPHDFGKLDSFAEVKMDLNFINKEFKNFLDSLNLEIHYARYFYSLPHQRYVYHIDCKAEEYDIIQNNVKLNFVQGGKGSEMIWYDLKPGKGPVFKKNFLGQPICRYNEEDLIEVHRATIGQPSLIDSFIVHTLQNADEDRHCWCVTLNSKITKERISWTEAIEIFKDYIIESV